MDKIPHLGHRLIVGFGKTNEDYRNSIWGILEDKINEIVEKLNELDEKLKEQK